MQMEQLIDEGMPPQKDNQQTLENTTKMKNSHKGFKGTLQKTYERIMNLKIGQLKLSTLRRKKKEENEKSLRHL